MKYVGAILFSVLSLLIAIGRTEGHMPWRMLMPNSEGKEWDKFRKKEYRKKEYKGILIFWAIATVAAFTYAIFFVD